MYSPLFALFLAAIALAGPADTTDPVVKTITAVVTVTGSTSTVIETSTASSNEEFITGPAVVTYTITSPDEANSIITSLEESLLNPHYPSWVSSVLATGIPTTWEEEMATNTAFFQSEEDAEASGILPDWYSSLPSDVRYILSSDAAVRASAEWTTFKYTFVWVTATTTAESSTTSTSTGGAPVATGGFVMGILGAAGIVGLTLVL